jgi:hypothetical protein
VLSASQTPFRGSLRILPPPARPIDLDQFGAPHRSYLFERASIDLVAAILSFVGKQDGPEQPPLGFRGASVRTGVMRSCATPVNSILTMSGQYQDSRVRGRMPVGSIACFFVRSSFGRRANARGGSSECASCLGVNLRQICFQCLR